MAGHIYITGDKHGTMLPIFGLAENNEISADDVLLITGDAGFVWDETYPKTVASLEKAFPGTIAFVDGNHENHDLLNALEISEWNGGRVHAVGTRTFHMMRGEVFTIHGQKIFAFGGARSSDKNDRRVEGVSWWSAEEPTAEEIAYGEAQLKEHLMELDYIITHEPPLFAREYVPRKLPLDEDYRLPAVLDEWYALAETAPNLKKWYFGHVHTDRRITPKLRCLYNEILHLTEERSIRWWK